MTYSGTPIQGQSAGLLASGARRGPGVVLLYRDKLAVVSTADILGYLIGPAFFAGMSVPFYHRIGWFGVFLAALMGRGVGETLNKRRAARKVAAGRDGVTVIPLDVIISMRTRKSTGIGGWFRRQTLLVTTADGAEYGFCGITAGWQTDLTDALTARGREVRATSAGTMVMPQAAAGEG